MSFIRRLDTHLKLYACFAVLLCLSTALSLWLLGQLGQIDAVTAVAAQKLSLARDRTWLCLAAIGTAGAMLAYWLRAEMARPVLQAAAMARKVAHGDLSTRGAAGDAGEGGALLLTMQEMNDNLVGMIIKVRAGTESIASSAGEIASGSMALSACTGEQAVSLEQTASAMAQLTATIKHNAGHAHQASKLALSASEMAAKGGAVVAEVVGSMASINDASQRIAELIELIDAIAFQTNTLALNAQEEAARAGEQGRGLAVVAAEVRKLAQRSAGAVRQIKLLIDDSVDKVNAGTLLADKAGKTMHDVVASVKRVTVIIGEIADASAGQTVGIEQVNQAIAAMDQATRHNATLVERATAAAVSMRDQAGGLSRATGAFVLGPGHPSTAPAIHLVASNPNKLSKARPARLAPMRVVAAPPAASGAGHAASAAGLRSRGGAARRGLDWVDF